MLGILIFDFFTNLTDGQCKDASTTISDSCILDVWQGSEYTFAMYV